MESPPTDRSHPAEQSGKVPDLRRFPRFNRSMLVKVLGKTGWHGRTLDISRRGVRIATCRRLEVGEKLILELYLTDNDPFPIRLKGECRWSEVSESNDNVAGIDLSLSHSRSLDILHEYLSQAGVSPAPGKLVDEEAEDFFIRPEQTQDKEAVETIIRQAFEHQEPGEQREAVIVNSLRSSGALSLSLVAVVEKVVVGHIAFSPVTIDSRDLGWFGLDPVSVQPERQERGIGQALVREGLEKLETLGAQGCVVLGDPKYFSRFGFRNHPPLIYPGLAAEHFQALSFSSELPQGTVAYHQAFSQELLRKLDQDCP